MKRYAPRWKDRDGNFFVFTQKNMIFKDEIGALEKSNSMFLSMLPMGLFNGGVIEFDMDKDGNIGLKGVEARFRIGDAYLVGGPKFDALVQPSEDVSCP
jgi:hypothetical protein